MWEAAPAGDLPAGGEEQVSRARSALLLGTAATLAWCAGSQQRGTKVTGDAPPAFRSLREAVSFIADCLDADRPEKLFRACTNRHGSSPFEDAVFRQLKERHGEQKLPRRYARRTFPRDKTKCKLGGHMKELGCLHIDFVKKNGAWRLERIWLCR